MWRRIPGCLRQLYWAQHAGPGAWHGGSNPFVCRLAGGGRGSCKLSTLSRKEGADAMQAPGLTLDQIVLTALGATLGSIMVFTGIGTLVCTLVWPDSNSKGFHKDQESLHQEIMDRVKGKEKAEVARIKGEA